MGIYVIYFAFGGVVLVGGRMTLLYFLLWPFIAGLVLFCFPKEKYEFAQKFNLAGNFVWAALLGLMFVEHPNLLDANRGAFPVFFNWSWMSVLSSRFSLGIDGINFPLIVLNIFISLTLAFYVLNKEKYNSRYLALFSILNAASVGSLMAADLFLFYFFWEFMLIPMYFLIGIWGGKNRIYATMKFFMITMAGSLCLLAAIVALSFYSNVGSLVWHDLVALNLPFEGWGSMQGWLFLAFLIAFAVKVPIWPLHTWLPDAHSEAPTGGSVILAAVLLKLGVYGLVRWALPLFPEASQAAAPFMLVLACLGIIAGALAAWVQTDIKRLIAYSSVSHLGFMVLGVFVFSKEALQGALFQNIAHGLSTGALFLIFGMIYDRTHNREISFYGGLASNAKLISFLFIFTTMASIGLPGLSGFVGEFLILSGSFYDNPYVTVAASSGILLGAIYMLSLVRRVFFGPTTANTESLDLTLNWSEKIAIWPYILLMLILGVLPAFVMTKSDGAVDLILQFLRN